MVDQFQQGGLRAQDAMAASCTAAGAKAPGCPNLIEHGTEALMAENVTAVWDMLRPFVLN